MMTDAEVTTTTSPAIAAAAAAQEVNVYCIEVTAQNVEAVRTLTRAVAAPGEGEDGVTAPSAESRIGAALLQSGVKGIELMAADTTRVADIRALVQQHRRQGVRQGTAEDASPAEDGDAMRLNLYAMTRAAAMRLSEPQGPGEQTPGVNDSEDAGDEEDDDAADPLVLLPDAVTLADMLASPQVLVLRPRAAAEAAATLLLFYSSGAQFGGFCCCGPFIGSILALFCCCCRSSGRRPRRVKSPCSSHHGSFYGNHNPLQQGPAYPASNGNCYPSNGVYYAAAAPPPPPPQALPPPQYNNNGYGTGAYYSNSNNY